MNPPNPSAAALSDDSGAFFLPVVGQEADKLRGFVGGSENRLLRSIFDAWSRFGAADAAAQPDYAALVLQGPTGVGKTLAIEVLARLWQERHPGEALVALTGSDFARGYQRATQTESTDAFRREVRGAKLFVLDPLDELLGRAQAQSELCRTLDAIFAQGGRFLGAIRAAVARGEGLSDALVGRLSQGLLAPVEPPSLATRRLLLAHLARQRKLAITPDAAEYLADGARRLGHPVTALHLFALLSRWPLEEGNPAGPPLPAGRHIDLAAAQRLLAATAQAARPARITTAEAARVTARHFLIKLNDLRGPSRRQSVVAARSVAMYLARSLGNVSLQQIGKYFSGRDHTTVMHACRKIEEQIKRDAEIRRAVEEIRRGLLM